MTGPYFVGMNGLQDLSQAKEFSLNWRQRKADLNNQINLLNKQLARRKKPGRRHKILMRIRDCETRMLALILAHR